MEIKMKKKGKSIKKLIAKYGGKNRKIVHKNLRQKFNKSEKWY